MYPKASGAVRKGVENNFEKHCEITEKLADWTGKLVTAHTISEELNLNTEDDSKPSQVGGESSSARWEKHSNNLVQSRKTARVAVFALARASEQARQDTRTIGGSTPVLGEIKAGVVCLPSEIICAPKSQGRLRFF